MTLEQYLIQKQGRQPSLHRSSCFDCRKPKSTCYCALIRPFESSPQFVILIHRDEARRSVATGRMAHLCVSNSLFIEGIDFTRNEKVNHLLQDPKKFPVILYPGKTALNLSSLSFEQRQEIVPPGKRLLVFILDGTWSQAKTMRRLSENLAKLPSLCFTPPERSKFLVRKQPHPHCYSTIEAMFEVIELFGKFEGQRHHNLLQVFQSMVSQQIAFEMEYGAIRGFRPTRGVRTPAG